MTDDRITSAEAGGVLGMHASAVELLAENGHLPGTEREGRWTFSRRAIETLAARWGVAGGVRTTAAVPARDPPRPGDEDGERRADAHHRGPGGGRV